MTNSFDKYYILLVESKDFTSLIDNKSFLTELQKTNMKSFEKTVEMSINNDYTTRNLLYYFSHKKHQKTIGTGL